MRISDWSSDVCSSDLLRMKADMDNKFEKVEEIACSMRDIFERILEDSIGTADPTGACLYASILLSTTLDKFAGTETLICGGGPPLDGGVIDPSGIVRGHYWIEGVTKEGTPFLVDKIGRAHV